MELANRLGVLDLTLQIGCVHPEIRAEDHAVREDVLGQALRLVAAIRSGETTLTDLPSDRLIGLDDQDHMDEYVGKLLHAGEEEILSRMLKSVVEQR